MKKFEQKSLKTSNNFHSSRNCEGLDPLINNKNGILENYCSPEFKTFSRNLKSTEVIPNIKESKKSLSHKKDSIRIANRNKSSCGVDSISAAAAEKINNIFCINLQNNYNNISNANDVNLNSNEFVFSRNQIEEKEFNSKRSFHKEIMKKIFTQESGDIIDFLKHTNKNLRLETNFKSSFYENKRIGCNSIQNAEGNLTNYQIISKKHKKDLKIDNNDENGISFKKSNKEGLIQNKSSLNDFIDNHNFSDNNSSNSNSLSGRSNKYADKPDEFPSKASKKDLYQNLNVNEESSNNKNNIKSNKSGRGSNFNAYKLNAQNDCKTQNGNIKSFSENMILQNKSDKSASKNLNNHHTTNKNFIKNKVNEVIKDIKDFEKASNFNSPNRNENANANQINFSNTVSMRFTHNNFKFSDKGRDSFYLTQKPLMFEKKKDNLDLKEKINKKRSESENKLTMFSIHKKSSSIYSNDNNKNNDNNNNNCNSQLFNNSNKNNYLVEKILTQKSNNYYCPNCEHCNIISDENLQKHFNLKEAKNIIKKSLDYIVNYYDTDQSYMDFILQNSAGKIKRQKSQLLKIPVIIRLSKIISIII